MKIDPEEALRLGNQKFYNRFNFIEKTLKVKNKDWSDTDLAEMEDLWVKAKHALGQSR
jgi:uncharacterized protein YabN with tetrapyrrole methylase and pyrophosphatase domain